MVGPAAKREAVAHLRSVVEMSERRACTLIAADRTMIRYHSRRPPDTELRARLREAQIVIESWRRHYNGVRPHASLGYRAPAPEVFVPAFAAGVETVPKLTLQLDHSMGADQLADFRL